MRDSGETASAIERYNKRTAARFGQVSGVLADELSEKGLGEWSGQVLAIASSGWHAFGSADVFLDISEPLVRSAGETALLDVGRFGLSLAGFSFEPGASYFRGIEVLIEAGALERAPIVETAGREIRDRFPHASSLVTEFFRIGFALAAIESRPTLDSWASAAVLMASDRTSLATFLESSAVADSVDWQFVERLREESADASLAYVEALPRLGSLVGDPSFEAITLRFAGTGEGVSDWLTSVEAKVLRLGQRERQTLWLALAELPSPSLALALLESVERLPMERPDIVLAWAAGAQEMLPLQVQGARGYLALESAASEVALERLRGQVNFEDVQRVLQLFTEAVSGARLTIEATTDDAEHYRDLPWTDGLTIRLPRSICRYPDRVRNFTLYKMSLLHQLGYYEFGTFDFALEGAVVGYRDYFRGFDDPALAGQLFQVLEDARVDWALERRYRGAAAAITNLKADAVESVRGPSRTVRDYYIQALSILSLDGAPRVADEFVADIELLSAQIDRLRDEQADVYLTMDVLVACYDIIAGAASAIEEPVFERIRQAMEDEASEPERRDAEVVYRGKLDPDRARINQLLANLEPEDIETSEDGEPMTEMLGEVDPKDLRIEQIRKGEVQNAIGTMIADVDVDGADDIDQEVDADGLEPFRGLIKDDIRAVDDLAFQYDEWDDVISDYRRRWCTLYETRRLDEKPAWVEDALRDLKSVASSVRRQLMHLKPELLRKVKGVEYGEELDLERTIESVVDRRSGRSPEERIYIQRIRRDRDVSALFLLDMSASTDDRVPAGKRADKQAPPAWDQDDFLHDYYGSEAAEGPRKRIIDVEKEAVILMAEALEELGDSYAICGFSGYGRDQVDFYLCKDFQETYNLRVKGRIGGIKPCRSTRMGPAIRHATRRLAETESRTKALIIISDGYPQDFDYGKDRNSKDYGIKDTTMALTEARRKGVQPFCLTVDPSGHDYLREMCPDQQYMVIQQIEQLPDELSKVYRSLTA